MEEELIPITDESVAVIEDGEDASMVSVIKLPGYESMNESKVLHGVKDVFKGFDQNSTSVKFADTEALANYAQATMDDIKAVRHTFDSSQILSRAAIMARFWYLGNTINNALQRGEYGSGAVNKLAAELGKKLSYIYSVRAVATKLSVVDCYLLGMRGLTTTDIRKLAQVRDDDTRKAITQAFIAEVTDTSDSAKMKEAKKRFISAVNVRPEDSLDGTVTSDPMNGGTDTEVTPEYDAVMKSLEDWQHMMRKPALEGPIEQLCAALADFFMPASAPDAQKHLDEVKTAATQTKAILQAVRNNIEDAVRELDSVMATELSTDEAAEQ